MLARFFFDSNIHVYETTKSQMHPSDVSSLPPLLEKIPRRTLTVTYITPSSSMKMKTKLVPLLSTPCGTTGKDYCYDGCHWITY